MNENASICMQGDNVFQLTVPDAGTVSLPQFDLPTQQTPSNPTQDLSVLVCLVFVPFSLVLLSFCYSIKEIVIVIIFILKQFNNYT